MKIYSAWYIIVLFIFCIILLLIIIIFIIIMIKVEQREEGERLSGDSLALVQRYNDIIGSLTDAFFQVCSPHKPSVITNNASNSPKFPPFSL